MIAVLAVPVGGFRHASSSSACLIELREAMATIRHEVPHRPRGAGPTAAGNCSDLLELLDRSLDHIAAYLDSPGR